MQANSSHLGTRVGRSHTGRACGSRPPPVLLPPRSHQQQSVTTTTTPPPQQRASAEDRFRWGLVEEQGLREGMEDALHVATSSNNGYLYAGCFDGHGGTAAAAWMRENLLTVLVTELKRQGLELSVDAAGLDAGLARAFKAADAQLLQHLEQLGGEDQTQSGCTATVMLLWPERVVTANVGDSQAFLWRAGQLVPLTTPHRVYGPGPEVAPEVKRVESTGGWVFDGRVCNVLAVSRAFGDWEFKGKGLPRLLSSGVERGYWPASFAAGVKFSSDPVIVDPDTADMEISEDDEFLVVSTDGLWDVMPPRDAMSWARKEFVKGGGPQEVAASLAKMAMKRYTTDNTSVMVVDLKGPEFWKAAGQKQGGFFSFLRR